MVRPSCSRRRNSSQLAQSGTRFELAISTRGAHSCVRMTPTGLPDCTSSVSSCSSVVSVRTSASKGLQLPAAPAGAAVDDEVARPLGVLRVEVVHQHAQRRLGLPRAGGEGRAAGGLYGASSIHALHCTPRGRFGTTAARPPLSGIPDDALACT